MPNEISIPLSSICYSLLIISIMWLFVAWAVWKKDKDILQKKHPRAEKNLRYPKIVDYKLKLDEWEEKIS
jgi:hypothetical protein